MVQGYAFRRVLPVIESLSISDIRLSDFRSYSSYDIVAQFVYSCKKLCKQYTAVSRLLGLINHSRYPSCRDWDMKPRRTIACRMR